MSNETEVMINRIKNIRERIYLPELLTAVNKEINKEKQLMLLRGFANRTQECKLIAFRFAKLMYHPQVTFSLPDGKPPYKSMYVDYNLAPMNILKVLEKIERFIPGHPDYIESKTLRENAFIKYLEGLYKDDAELIIMIKDGDLHQYKNITEELIREAYPGWLPEPVEKGGAPKSVEPKSNEPTDEPEDNTQDAIVEPEAKEAVVEPKPKKKVDAKKPAPKKKTEVKEKEDKPKTRKKKTEEK